MASGGGGSRGPRESSTVINTKYATAIRIEMAPVTMATQRPRV
jgi:hypothetical protein